MDASEPEALRKTCLKSFNPCKRGALDSPARQVTDGRVDRALHGEVGQLEELMKIVSPKNATLFAYGVTGSGKTMVWCITVRFTGELTDKTMQGTAQEPGIIPRVARVGQRETFMPSA
jgi:hypothetical protein